MSTTYTSAADIFKKLVLQELKDQRALSGKNSYQSLPTWYQTTPTSPGQSPTDHFSWDGRKLYSLPPARRLERGRTPPPPFPPPTSNTDTTPYLLGATEQVGALSGGGG